MDDSHYFQLYRQAYDGFAEGRGDKEATFVVDSLAGRDTSFKVFFPDLTESYVRGLSISNRAAGSFSTIMDSQASSQYLSVYDVPFDMVSKPFIALRNVSLSLPFKGAARFNPSLM